MKHSLVLLLLAWTLPAEARPSRQVSGAALVAAAKQATLKMIDYGEDHCDGGLTVDAWLTALVGKEARSIAWAGGKCVLVNDMQGRPGKAYAFRGVMETRDGGPDYVRFRRDFEAVWEERFSSPPTKPRCKDE